MCVVLKKMTRTCRGEEILGLSLLLGMGAIPTGIWLIYRGNRRGNKIYLRFISPYFGSIRGFLPFFEFSWFFSHKQTGIYKHFETMVVSLLFFLNHLLC